MLALRGDPAGLVYGYAGCRKKTFIELCKILNERFGALSNISKDKKKEEEASHRNLATFGT